MPAHYWCRINYFIVERKKILLVQIEIEVAEWPGSNPLIAFISAH